MDESDEILVRRVRGGDAGAFGLLVQRYLQAAYAVALAQLGEPADAEDVSQDAFITALKQIDECHQPAKFGSWLLTIVRNRARDFRRYRSTRDALPLREDLAENDRAGPLREAEQSEVRRDLLEAMNDLTVLQREVVLLYDLEGWNHRDIGARLDISTESSRVHLHNGRKALRTSLAELYGEKE